MNIEDLLRIEILYATDKSLAMINDQSSEVYYSGFIFKDNRVYCRNIYWFDAHNDYKAEYQEVTAVFERFRNRYSIIKICCMVLKKVRNYYKDCEFTFYMIPLISSIQDHHKQKSLHEIRKHNARYEKFITGNQETHNKYWCDIFSKPIYDRQRLARLTRIEKKYIPYHKKIKGRKFISGI